MLESSMEIYTDSLPVSKTPETKSKRRSSAQRTPFLDVKNLTECRFNPQGTPKNGSAVRKSRRSKGGILTKLAVASSSSSSESVQSAQSSYEKSDGLRDGESSLHLLSEDDIAADIFVGDGKKDDDGAGDALSGFPGEEWHGASKAGRVSGQNPAVEGLEETHIDTDSFPVTEDHIYHRELPLTGFSTSIDTPELDNSNISSGDIYPQNLSFLLKDLPEEDADGDVKELLLQTPDCALDLDLSGGIVTDLGGCPQMCSPHSTESDVGELCHIDVHEPGYVSATNFDLEEHEASGSEIHSTRRDGVILPRLEEESTYENADVISNTNEAEMGCANVGLGCKNDFTHSSASDPRHFFPDFDQPSSLQTEISGVGPSNISATNYDSEENAVSESQVQPTKGDEVVVPEVEETSSSEATKVISNTSQAEMGNSNVDLGCEIDFTLDLASYSQHYYFPNLDQPCLSQIKTSLCGDDSRCNFQSDVPASVSASAKSDKAVEDESSENHRYEQIDAPPPINSPESPNFVQHVACDQDMEGGSNRRLTVTPEVLSPPAECDSRCSEGASKSGPGWVPPVSEAEVMEAIKIVRELVDGGLDPLADCGGRPSLGANTSNMSAFFGDLPDPSLNSSSVADCSGNETGLETASQIEDSAPLAKCVDADDTEEKCQSSSVEIRNGRSTESSVTHPVNEQKSTTHSRNEHPDLLLETFNQFESVDVSSSITHTSDFVHLSPNDVADTVLSSSSFITAAGQGIADCGFASSVTVRGSDSQSDAALPSFDELHEAGESCTNLVYFPNMNLMDDVVYAAPSTMQPSEIDNRFCEALLSGASIGSILTSSGAFGNQDNNLLATLDVPSDLLNLDDVCCTQPLHGDGDSLKEACVIPNASLDIAAIHGVSTGWESSETALTYPGNIFKDAILKVVSKPENINTSTYGVESLTPHLSTQTNFIAKEPGQSAISVDEAACGVGATISTATSSYADVSMVTDSCVYSDVSMVTEAAPGQECGVQASAESAEQETMTEKSSVDAWSSMTPFRMGKHGTRLTAEEVRRQHPRVVANQLETTLRTNQRLQKEVKAAERERGVLKEAKSKLAERDSRLADLESRLTEAESLVKQQGNLLQEERAKTWNAEQGFQTTKSELEEHRLNAKKDLDAQLGRANADSAAEISGYREQLQSAQQKIRELQAAEGEYKALLEEADVTRQLQVELIEKTGSLKSMVTDLAASQQQLKMENKDLKKQCISKEVDLDVLRYEMKELHMDKDMLEGLLTRSNHCVNELETMLNTANLEVDRLQNELAELTAENTALSEGMGVLRQSQTLLLSQLAEQQDSETVALEGLAKVQGELERTQADLAVEKSILAAGKAMHENMKFQFEETKSNLQQLLDESEEKAQSLEQELYDCREQLSYMEELESALAGNQKELRDGLQALGGLEGNMEELLARLNTQVKLFGTKPTKLQPVSGDNITSSALKPNGSFVDQVLSHARPGKAVGSWSCIKTRGQRLQQSNLEFGALDPEFGTAAAAMLSPHSQSLSYNRSSQKILDSSRKSLSFTEGSKRRLFPDPTPIKASVSGLFPAPSAMPSATKSKSEASTQSLGNVTPGYARIRSIPSTASRRLSGIGTRKGAGGDGAQIPENKGDLEEKLLTVQELYSQITKVYELVERGAGLAISDAQDELQFTKEQLVHEAGVRQKLETEIEGKSLLLTSMTTHHRELQTRVTEMTNSLLGFQDQSFKISRLEEEKLDLKWKLASAEGQYVLLSDHLQAMVTKVDTAMAGQQGYCDQELLALKREKHEWMMKLFEERERHQQLGDKAVKRMKVLESNWKKAEDEVRRLDELMEEVRKGCVSSQTQHKHPLILGIVRFIDGKVPNLDGYIRPSSSNSMMATTPTLSATASSSSQRKCHSSAVEAVPANPFPLSRRSLAPRMSLSEGLDGLPTRGLKSVGGGQMQGIATDLPSAVSASSSYAC